MQLHIVIFFLAKSLQSGRKRPIWHHFTSAWKQGWKSRRSFSRFISRLKIKNMQKKDCPSIFITHRAIFVVENSVTLTIAGYSTAFWICPIICLKIQGKEFERINQREERRTSETKGDKRNQASIKLENVSASYYQQGRAIFSFDWKSKRFSVSRK